MADKPSSDVDDQDDQPVLSDEEAGDVSGSGHGPASAWAATFSYAGTAVPSNCQRCEGCPEPGPRPNTAFGGQ